jgi:hypothetical protein
MTYIVNLDNMLYENLCNAQYPVPILCNGSPDGPEKEQTHRGFAPGSSFTNARFDGKLLKASDILNRGSYAKDVNNNQPLD